MIHPQPCRPVRFAENPLITGSMLGNPDENINGPSLIRVPDWVASPLGRYYLYFAHHEGRHIRLAYADDLHGPWRIHAPGVLHVDDVPGGPDHVASPDVIVDEADKRILLYFHCPTLPVPRSDDPGYAARIEDQAQQTYAAVSANGLDFAVHPRVAGEWYFRVWRWNGFWYALARGGSPLYRSRDGLAFERAPVSPFDANPNLGRARHTALKIDGDVLTVFYSRIGDAPEHILATTIRLTPDWTRWQASDPVSVLVPERDYEGADLPTLPSLPGLSLARNRELRDPAIFRENARTYLLYTIQGEYGIAAAELADDDQADQGRPGPLLQPATAGSAQTGL